MRSLPTSRPALLLPALLVLLATLLSPPTSSADAAAASTSRRFGYYAKSTYEAPEGKCCQICTENFLHDLNFLQMPAHLERAVLRRFFTIHGGRLQHQTHALSLSHTHTHMSSALRSSATPALPLFRQSPAVLLETGVGTRMSGGAGGGARIVPPECCTMCPEQYIPTGWYDRKSFLELREKDTTHAGRCGARYHVRDHSSHTDHASPSAEKREGDTTSVTSFIEVGHRNSQRVAEIPGCPGEHVCCYVCGEEKNAPRDYMANVNFFLETSQDYLTGLRRLQWARRGASKTAKASAIDAPRFNALHRQQSRAHALTEAESGEGAEAGGRSPGGCCVQCAIKLEVDEVPFAEPYVESDRRDWIRKPYAP